jgi:hypothetical protein
VIVAPKCHVEQVRLERQQYFALMHEHGVIDVTYQDQLAFATALEAALLNA